MLIVAPNDQGGTDSGEQLKEIYKSVGVEASTEYFQRGTTNFAAIATRVMLANPAAVEMSTIPPADASTLVKQLLEAGYDGVFGSLGGIGPQALAEGAGSLEDLGNAYWLETSPVDAPAHNSALRPYTK